MPSRYHRNLRRIATASRSALGIGLAALLVAATLGCPADEGARMEQAKTDLMRRAQAHWEAKAAGRFEEAYRFLEPELKARVSLQEWQGSLGLVQWSDPEVLDAKVAGNRGIVKIRFDWKLTGTLAEGKEGETEGATELWIRVGDVWYKEEPVPFETPDWDAFPEEGAESA